MEKTNVHRASATVSRGFFLLFLRSAVFSISYFLDWRAWGNFFHITNDFNSPEKNWLLMRMIVFEKNNTKDYGVVLKKIGVSL